MECQAPMNRRKAPLLKYFSRRFCMEGGGVKTLRAIETYKKDRYHLWLFLFINDADFKNNNKNYRKSFRTLWVPE